MPKVKIECTCKDGQIQFLEGDFGFSVIPVRSDATFSGDDN